MENFTVVVKLHGWISTLSPQTFNSKNSSPTSPMSAAVNIAICMLVSLTVSDPVLRPWDNAFTMTQWAYGGYNKVLFQY